MSLQTIEINSHRISFDKEKTQNHRTEYNNPCDCQSCRNYYKNIENNPELLEFLSGFGVDHCCAEEVFSWDLGNDPDSLIHSEGHYGIDGHIDGEEFSFEKFGVTVSFTKAVSIPHDRTGDYFWVIIESDFPYILDEKRDLPVVFSRGVSEPGFFDRIKAFFKKSKEN